ncbi:MAG: hypothetical protein Roseis2KO_22090 [Roseivirga sp.]
MGVAANMVVTLVSYPVFIHYLGSEVYGLWITMSVIVALGEMGNLGIAQASVKFVSEKISTNQLSAAQGYYATGLVFVLAIGAVFLLLPLIFSHLILSALGVEITSELLSIVRWLGLLGALSFLISYQYGVLTASKLNYLMPLFMGFRNLMKLGFGVLFFSVYSKDLSAILWATIISTFVTFSILNIFLKVKSVLSPLNLNGFTKGNLRELLRYGVSIFGSKVSNILLIPVVKLTVASRLSFSAVTYLELSYNSAFAVRSLFERGLVTLIPESSGLKSFRASLGLIKKSYKFVIPVALVFYSGLIYFSEEVLTLWLSEEYNEVIRQGFILFNLAFFVSLLGVPMYFIFMGLGFPKYCFFESLIKLCTTYLVLMGALFISDEFTLIQSFYALSDGFALSHIYLILVYLRKHNA